MSGLALGTSTSACAALEQVATHSNPGSPPIKAASRARNGLSSSTMATEILSGMEVSSSSFAQLGKGDFETDPGPGSNLTLDGEPSSQGFDARTQIGQTVSTSERR